MRMHCGKDLKHHAETRIPLPKPTINVARVQNFNRPSLLPPPPPLPLPLPVHRCLGPYQWLGLDSHSLRGFAGGSEAETSDTFTHANNQWNGHWEINARSGGWPSSYTRKTSVLSRHRADANAAEVPSSAARAAVEYLCKSQRQIRAVSVTRVGVNACVMWVWAVSHWDIWWVYCVLVM